MEAITVSWLSFLLIKFRRDFWFPFLSIATSSQVTGRIYAEDSLKTPADGAVQDMMYAYTYGSDERVDYSELLGGQLYDGLTLVPGV